MMTFSRPELEALIHSLELLSSYNQVRIEGELNVNCGDIQRKLKDEVFKRQ